MNKYFEEITYQNKQKEAPKIILGVGGSLHGFSSCLVIDGEVKVAIEEERLTGKKRSMGICNFDLKGINYCLEFAGLTKDDINCVAYNHILDPRVVAHFDYSPKAVMSHHYAHAGSATWPSPFDEASVIIVDNSGSFDFDIEKEEIISESLSYLHFNRKKKKLTFLDQQYSRLWSSDQQDQNFCKNDSLGGFYAKVAKLIGCTSVFADGKEHTESGKMMGLSAYGSPIYKDRILKYIELKKDGKFSIALHNGIIDEIEEILSSVKGDAFKTKADIASSAQKITEDLLLHCAKWLHSRTNDENLCIAGGVALNGLSVQRILDETPFKKIYVPTAAHDSGTSTGAALNIYHLSDQTDSCSKQHQKPQCYLGREYSNEFIEGLISKALSLSNDVFSILTPNNYYEYVATAISEGSIVAWFAGASEFGPRALGNRSLLADVRSRKSSEKVNSIKRRELYHPLAPSVVADRSSDFFTSSDSPFMSRVINIKEDKKELIPAVTHIDGTARIQTVTATQNIHFYNLLVAIGNITGIPMVLNTSLNIQGMPLVETPAEALEMFLKEDIQLLCFPTIILKK